MRLHLFENYSQDQGTEWQFKTPLLPLGAPHTKGGSEFTIHSNLPIMLVKGDVTWSCEMSPRPLGIHIKDIKLISVYLELENEETGDTYEFLLGEKELSPLNFTYETHEFPLYLSSLVCECSSMEAPHEWKFLAHIGYEKD